MKKELKKELTTVREELRYAILFECVMGLIMCVCSALAARESGTVEQLEQQHSQVTVRPPRFSDCRRPFT